MKKNYLLLSVLLLASCSNNNQVSESTKEETKDTTTTSSLTSESTSKVSETSTSSEISTSSETESSLPLAKVSKVELDSNFMNNDYAKIIGKNYYKDDHVVLTQSLSYVDVNFFGTKLSATLEDNKTSYITVLVDDDTTPGKDDIQQVSATKTNQVLVEGLENKEHHVRFYKNNEACESLINLYGLETDGYFLEKDKKDHVKIEYFGDSITCGYGMYAPTANNDGFVMSQENACVNYAYYTSLYANADFIMTCASGWGLYSSYGGNTDAAIPKYVSQCDFTNNVTWDNSLFSPDFVVINLGTNDGGEYNRLDAIKDKTTYLANVREAYFDFVETLNTIYGTNTQIILSYGMMGTSEHITKIINDICKKYDNCQSLFYTSETVGGTMYAGHPNEAMHKYASEELYMMIMPYIEEE